MHMAVSAAELSTARQRHGAVVVRNGNLLSVGWNVDVNHPTHLSEEHIKAGASIHAEIKALSGVKNTKGVTVYVARINKQGKKMYSRPCARCEDELDSLGIKRVIHT